MVKHYGKWPVHRDVRRAGTLRVMSDTAEYEEPRAHARIAYLGSVSPHWEVYGDWGDRQVLDEFRARVLARLVLLPRDASRATEIFFASVSPST